MTRAKFDPRGVLFPVAAAAGALIFASPAGAQAIEGQTQILGPTLAQAQTPEPDTSTAPAQNAKPKGTRPKVSDVKPVSPNATVNLVNLLVKQGIITEEQGQALIKEAEDEAYISRQANKDASQKADDAQKAASDAAAAASPPGTKHVTYVPEIVKQQLRDEIKKEVMSEAQKENWASPGAYPEWAQRIRLYGDMRLRYERVLYPTGNAPQINFNAINTGSPFDVSGNTGEGLTSIPVLDTTENRTLERLRARLGADITLDYGVTAGIRLATGDTAAPVSTSATFGQNGGDFSKYAIWLDRGYLQFQSPNDNLRLMAGRFDNPFWQSTDLVWYSELGFDGAAAQIKYEVLPGITPFITGGAFVLFDTSLNTSYTLDVNPAVQQDTGTNVPSDDKYLFGGQVGVNAQMGPDYDFKFATAYFDFNHVQGQESDPCTVNTDADVCSTDLSRPSYAQYGNTYFELRDILPNPSLAAGTQPQFQFFGLASQFTPLVGSAELDIANFRPYHIILDGEYVRNLAWDRAAIMATDGGLGPVNNNAATPNGVGTGLYDGGNQGFMARLTVGDPEIKHLWDWNVHAGYKYLESDATLDAFVDPDFGLGGTNLKGYIVGANLGVAENVWTSVKWMSANNIAGSPYNVDVLLVDVNARF
jgi:hypothetical protein